MQQLQQEIDISQWNDFKQENAQDWDVFGVLTGLLSVIQGVLRGGYKRPSLAFGEEWRFDLFAYECERSTLTNQNALPTSLEGRLCPRLDSNQHAVSSATTSR
jgi:hypothetical protein